MIRFTNGKVDRVALDMAFGHERYRNEIQNELADALDVLVAALRFYAKNEGTTVANEALRQIGADHAEG